MTTIDTPVMRNGALNRLKIAAFILLAGIGRAEATMPLSSWAPAESASTRQLVLVEGFQTKPGMSSMDAWKEVDLSRWKPQKAEELTGLFSSLFSGYVKFRGAPTMSIDINEAPRKTYEVFIKQEGLRDDSVAGERWAAKVKHSEDGWYLEKMWWQQKCYRGFTAGTWTKRKCL